MRTKEELKVLIEDIHTADELSNEYYARAPRKINNSTKAALMIEAEKDLNLGKACPWICLRYNQGTCGLIIRNKCQGIKLWPTQSDLK